VACIEAVKGHAHCWVLTEEPKKRVRDDDDDNNDNNRKHYLSSLINNGENTNSDYDRTT